MSRLIEPLTTPEDVYEATENGLTVFEQEIPDFSLCRNVKNPFVDVDRNPSARIKQSKKSSLWLLHIYNDEGGYYTCISFIQKKYNLGFREAIDYIMGKVDNAAPIVKTTLKEAKKSVFYYDFEPMEYSQAHKDYYCCGLDEEFLTKEMDIFAVKRYAINKNIKYPKKDELMFCYEHKDINGIPTNRVKLLTIGKNVDKLNKWRTNCLPYEFFYTHKIQGQELVFVTKSNKDSACIQKLGITSIATMSENRHNIATGLKDLIVKFPKTRFILNLGSDLQALTCSQELSKEFNLGWFNIPKRFLVNDVNDNFGMVKTFGMEALEKELRKKKFIT